MKEAKFQEHVIKFLKEQPLTWIVKVWGGGYQKSGIPDILCCINGTFVAIELKKEGGRATELQKRNIRLINEAKGIGIILYPNGFDDFKDQVRELINE